MATGVILRRVGASAIFIAAATTAFTVNSTISSNETVQGGSLQARIADTNAVVPPRRAHLSALIGASADDPLDILVIGGGATGCGVALDAATRGLRVGLVEREDFSSGTSSRSTKLIHGGRHEQSEYLKQTTQASFYFSQRARLFYSKLKLVFHALKERKQVIDNAPHLCHSLPCMTPCFDWYEAVYYWAGLKLYDLVAGPRLLHLSRYYSAQESIELFPTLRRVGNGKSLKGTVVYYDGQMNDSRLNVGLACTAALAGASVLNHAEVVSLLNHEVDGRIIGARVCDNLSGEEFATYAKVVVNAAGPFCDSIRKLARADAPLMICPSSGVHIVLPDYYSPEGMGLIVPKTKDGRVVFMLPWLGRTVAGTTDSNTEITLLPEPHEGEIQFILEAISDYLNVKVRREDVLSAWSGIRPLAMDPRAKTTEGISRDHVVCEDFPGLVTITGGKWTTYRSMAEDAVDAAIKSAKLSPANECMTNNLILIGGYSWDPASFTTIAQQYIRMKRTYGGKVVPAPMDTAVAKHLSHAYGTLAERVASIAQKYDPKFRPSSVAFDEDARDAIWATFAPPSASVVEANVDDNDNRAIEPGTYVTIHSVPKHEGLGKRLAHGYPFLEAEVAYCARYEYCESATDFIARRCRLAFLDTDAASRALPRVIEIMAGEHNWSRLRKNEELKQAKEFLETFKSSKNAQFHDGKH
ncbi:hypothetical protein Cgig2_027008 [Carnegiea gigantea]|uniref:Glycerol-3-phosphate dehydrogenase n=1 Tax=Carnegiea gigantea TaxID=171969 RepID=A0A9Q1GMR6_9CARY|nr:hypothetical protein Cgig2_027008 [Carnegiea gigantea]